MLELAKASTSDALVINSISKRSFESDVTVGSPSVGGPPAICLFHFIPRWPGQIIYTN